MAAKALRRRLEDADGAYVLLICFSHIFKKIPSTRALECFFVESLLTRNGTKIAGLTIVSYSSPQAQRPHQVNVHDNSDSVGSLWAVNDPRRLDRAVY